MTSDPSWWMVAVSTVACLIFFRCLILKSRRTTLSSMRNDGLTDQDIEDIIGRDGLRKLKVAAGE